MYKTFILLAILLSLSACRDKPANSTLQSAENTRYMLDSRLDMTGADTFRCFSATIINQGEAYTEEDFPAPQIAVLDKTRKYIIIGIGRDRIVLRSFGGDTLRLKGQLDKHLLRAYRNASNMTIDSVVILGANGQGRTIMRYKNVREKEKEEQR